MESNDLSRGGLYLNQPRSTINALAPSNLGVLDERKEEEEEEEDDQVRIEERKHGQGGELT